MQSPFPGPSATCHNDTSEGILPLRPELSGAGTTAVIIGGPRTVCSSNHRSQFSLVILFPSYSLLFILSLWIPLGPTRWISVKGSVIERGTVFALATAGAATIALLERTDSML
ncbi:hypothetical protein DSL72_006445 [Monilinia vaccinii-corymbosi]|uniref:Uncharacterized protein n=1 Tax=Monilinia vaccinii-corymbosi TaxID=61207 RepID=A0A8A3PNQ7_9HELO|nr:hypothetical protein DSL72_006445 [Monilinia vaccinii-corymbosi]